MSANRRYQPKFLAANGRYLVAPGQPPDGERCVALTVRGARCWRRRLAPSGLCWQHFEQARARLRRGSDGG